MRTVPGYLLLYVKGLLMGAADVVPGVSGGTIAFISGIYLELLDSIKSVNTRSLGLLLTQGPRAFWEAVNGNFFLVLLAGICTSIFTLARVVSYALENHPLQVWSLFFGLIVASIIYIGRQLSRWQLPHFLTLALGAGLALLMALAPPQQLGTSLPAVFLSGMLAICAMILPGISGSFILLLIGMYPLVIDAVARLDLSVLSTFAIGAGVGLLVFSRLLSWLLHHCRDLTLALLTGFLAGSLVIVWPWKRALVTEPDGHGHFLVVSREFLSPARYAELVGDPALSACLSWMLAGLVLVLGLEYLGGRRDDF